MNSFSYFFVLNLIVNLSYFNIYTFNLDSADYEEVLLNVTKVEKTGEDNFKASLRKTNPISYVYTLNGKRFIMDTWKLPKILRFLHFLAVWFIKYKLVSIPLKVSNFSTKANYKVLEN